MTILYVLENTLYINLTNRCTNRCTFCVRDKDCGIGDYNLWLEREPEATEITECLKQEDLSRYDEIVFCGYGEPMMRLDTLLAVASYLKKACSIPLRINTNGQANLIYKEDITPKLKGLIDTVSISLNAKNAQEYDALCKSVYGQAAFASLCDFAKKCADLGIHTVMSVVDVLPQGDIVQCKTVAEQNGAQLRVRALIDDE